MIAALLFAALVPTSCEGGSTSWSRFNATDDALVVQVTASADRGDERVVALYSNTGVVQVGQASVVPGSGPVGTEHQLVVQVDEPWDAQVQHATVTVHSDRGVDQTFELTQDSASAGMWVIGLRSGGVLGEERMDTWAIALEEPDSTPADSGTSGG